MRAIIATVKVYWPYYVCAWLLFPVLVFLFRVLHASVAVEFIPVLLFALAAGLLPWVPWFRGRVNYWVNAFWAIFIPTVALLLALAVAQSIAA